MQVNITTAEYMNLVDLYRGIKKSAMPGSTRSKQNTQLLKLIRKIEKLGDK